MSEILVFLGVSSPKYEIEVEAEYAQPVVDEYDQWPHG